MGDNGEPWFGAGAGFREMSRRWIIAAVVAFASGTGTVHSAAGGSCRAEAPADLTGGPARWLGDCSNGAAEGLGVMRVGSAEPYRFFLGEMKNGLPLRGMMKTADGWEMAARFDPSRVAQSPRSWNPGSSHAMYLLAARAARVTARRFAATGNRSSAAYYERLARQVADGEPE